MIYFTADMHFGHSGVIQFCKRPFVSIEEMNATIIRRWNSRVKSEDTIYVLGDMSFVRFSEAVPIFAQLNGVKILVQGNHDKYSATQYQKLGFSAVVQEAKVIVAGKALRLSHYPYRPTFWERLRYAFNDLRYLDRRPVDTGEVLLHGHVHEKWKVRDRMINVGVDQWDFFPVSVGQLESVLSAIV